MENAVAIAKIEEGVAYIRETVDEIKEKMSDQGDEIQNPYSQSFKQRVQMSDFDNCLLGIGSNLVILAEAAGMIQPTEGTLDHPAPGKLFPLVWFDLYRYVNTKTKDFIDVGNESTTIPHISAKPLNRGVAVERELCRFYT